MICLEVVDVGGGVLQLQEVACTGEPGAFVLQQQSEVGASFFNIPLNQAPGLLGASLALILVAFASRAARKALD